MDQEGEDPDFSATTEVIEDRVVVTVTGEVDMSTAGEMLDAGTRFRAGAATVDLRAVTFFDSAAIHALLKLAERYAGRLTVLPSPPVRRVLEISGLATQPWLAAGDEGAAREGAAGAGPAAESSADARE